MPQYIASWEGRTRLPYIFRAIVTGLQPNLKYRYYTNACRYTDFWRYNQEQVIQYSLTEVISDIQHQQD
ncbi:MAG: hypothetical protein IPG09_15915 [Ignavibacteria bacterium]|nr:hypothetical protein [Ignavibacteria bacterium]